MNLLSITYKDNEGEHLVECEDALISLTEDMIARHVVLKRAVASSQDLGFKDLYSKLKKSYIPFTFTYMFNDSIIIVDTTIDNLNNVFYGLSNTEDSKVLIEQLEIHMPFPVIEV